MAAKFFRIRDSGPWGGYGSVLWHGFDSGAQSLIELHRCGPFVPAITLVNQSLVVWPSVALRFAQNFGENYSLRDVTIKKVVHLDWSSWDLEADCPPVEPGGGNEPEDFVLSRPNDPDIVHEIGSLTEIVPAIGAYVDQIRVPVSGTRRGFTLNYRVRIDTWNSNDFFWAAVSHRLDLDRTAQSDLNIGLRSSAG